MIKWLKRMVSRDRWIPPYTRLTYQSWIANPENIGAAYAVISLPEFSRMLSLVQNCRPQGYPLRGETVTSEQALIELGRIQGYNDCMSLFISLGNLPAKAQDPLEADFLPPEPTIEDHAS